MNMNNKEDKKHNCDLDGHKWRTAVTKEGDSGLFGIATNLLFGGVTEDYEIQECIHCGLRKKITY